MILLCVGVLVELVEVEIRNKSLLHVTIDFLFVASRAGERNSNVLFVRIQLQREKKPFYLDSLVHNVRPTGGGYFIAVCHEFCFAIFVFDCPTLGTVQLGAVWHNGRHELTKLLKP